MDLSNGEFWFHGARAWDGFRRAIDYGETFLDYNLATINEAIAEAVPDREAIVFRDRRFTYADLTQRTRRFRETFSSNTASAATPKRGALDDWRSGQDHLGIYLYNGNEFLEGMLGAYKARVAPFNVNYRYVDEETHLPVEQRTHAGASLPQFAARSTCSTCRDQVPSLELLIQVNDEPAPPARRRSGVRGRPGRSQRGKAALRMVAGRSLHALYRGNHGHAEKACSGARATY